MIGDRRRDPRWAFVPGLVVASACCAPSPGPAGPPAGDPPPSTSTAAPPIGPAAQSISAPEPPAAPAPSSAASPPASSLADRCPPGVDDIDRPDAPCIDVARRRIFTPSIDLDDAGLTATGKAVLDRVAALLKAHPALTRVEIGAHDSLEPRSFVDRTRRWARLVTDHLVALGIPPERLRPLWYGASRPIDTNDTPEGRSHNRRIELVLLPE